MVSISKLVASQRSLCLKVDTMSAEQHMEDMYHEYIHECSNYGDEFCEPAIAAIEDAKREAEDHMKQKKEKSKK